MLLNSNLSIAEPISEINVSYLFAFLNFIIVRLLQRSNIFKRIKTIYHIILLNKCNKLRRIFHYIKYFIETEYFREI